MAAYAALVSLINDLELIPNHPRHSFSFENKQIASLSQTVHFLIDFLESYDAHGCSRETAEVLESRIASAAHDVVESHVVDQIHAGSTLRGKVRAYFFFDLQKAIDNMNFVERKVMQFKARSGMKTEQHTYSPTTPSEAQTLRKNRMVGFDAVADRLMEMLVGEDSRRLVIPIVGMGGMGKTTLAKNAYENSFVDHHFDVHLWATISQEYNAENILKQLIFPERKSPSGATVNKLGNELHRNLWGRRYLIILDDMWSMEAWDEIHMFLPDNSNGSRVIVTTRLCNLAANLSSYPIQMGFLDEDESWKLFCREAFDEEECPLELQRIGKRIMRKCQGLPLSIIVIAGHLRKSSRTVACWGKVANLMNPISNSDEGEKCMKIISLSYDQLPICLKPCFLYMGKFSEDERISPRKLVRLWVAEGFVRAKEGKSSEEIAEDYLNDLIGRNLVILLLKRNGKPQTCGIHDLVRELSLKVGKKDKFVSMFDKTEDVSKERRIVIPHGKQGSDMVTALKSAPLLRSLTCVQHHFYNLLQLRSLRLLRVSECDRQRTKEGGLSPTADDFQQVNLRFLRHPCFSQNREIHSLPWSISLFWNLQTLIMASYAIEIIAPQEIWEMIQLRHLEFYRLYLPNPIPRECIVLQNLQTLVEVANLKLTEDVCERMPNIKELSLWYDSSGRYYPCNFDRFSKLESLKLFGRDSFQSFTLPISLQELCLRGFNLDWEGVREIIKSLPHLVALRLGFIKGRKWSLVEEEFPRLRSLEIFSCRDLIYWNANSSHFPALETLHIDSLPKLSEIPFDIGEIPTLLNIKLDYCSVHAAVSAMTILAEQESFGNEDLRLDVLFEGTKEIPENGAKRCSRKQSSSFDLSER